MEYHFLCVPGFHDRQPRSTTAQTSNSNLIDRAVKKVGNILKEKYALLKLYK
jgi:hypothetical protein